MEATAKQFRYYRTLGDRTFQQLSDTQLFFKPEHESNSIAMVVKHMSGNMKSRFTDFLETDGEKPWRNRDGEFDDGISTREELELVWNEGWDITLAAIEQLDVTDLERLVFIRNIGHTVCEALLRQLAHYAYHVGQIVMLGVMQRGSDWQSLTIPKGQSDSYNARAFAQEKHRGHFADLYLSQDDKGK